MPIKNIPCKLSFVMSAVIQGKEGQFTWKDVKGVLDLHDRKILCRILVTPIQAVALNFFSQNLKISEILIPNENRVYHVDLNRLKYWVSFGSSLSFDEAKWDVKPLNLAFSFHASTLEMNCTEAQPSPCNEKYVLWFSGVRARAFHDEVEYEGQKIEVQTRAGGEILQMSSDQAFSEELIQTGAIAFSLYQNAEVKLLEQIHEQKIILNVQTAPDPGADLPLPPQVFRMLWEWLAKSGYAKTKRNIFSCYFSGARLRGEYTELKLTELFLCMNAICGGGGRFGLNLSRHFHISEGDGIWLSYVRNKLVHEGASLDESILAAYPEFEENQVPRGKTLHRYANLTEKMDANERCNFVYCDAVNLIFAYFMEKAGYPNPFLKELQQMEGEKTEESIEGDARDESGKELPPLPLMTPDILN